MIVRLLELHLLCQRPSAGLRCFQGPFFLTCQGDGNGRTDSRRLTFDDVLLLPGKSSVLSTGSQHADARYEENSAEHPLVSAAMDTVTESRLAIAMARQGGLGFVHRSMSIDRQAEEVDRVKRSRAGWIVDPVTISPDLSVRDAMEIMTKIPRLRLAGHAGATPGGHLDQSRPAL